MFSVPLMGQPGRVSTGHWHFAFSVHFHWSRTMGKVLSFAFVLMKSNKHQGICTGICIRDFICIKKKKRFFG